MKNFPEIVEGGQGKVGKGFPEKIPEEIKKAWSQGFLFRGKKGDR